MWQLMENLSRKIWGQSGQASVISSMLHSLTSLKSQKTNQGLNWKIGSTSLKKWCTCGKAEMPDYLSSRNKNRKYRTFSPKGLPMLMTSSFLYTMRKNVNNKPSSKKLKRLWATSSPVLSESLAFGVSVRELALNKSKSSSPGQSSSRPVLYLP